MNSFNAILIATVFYVLPCLICLIVAFFDDDAWEIRPLVIMSLLPIVNVMATAAIIEFYCGAFKNKKTKKKETIEDKYNRLTKEGYDA